MSGTALSLLLLASLAGLSMGAPGWMEESYQDLMTSITNKDVVRDTRSSILGQWDKLGGRMDEMEDYWGDHLETVGQQMGSRFKKFGNDLEDRMLVAKDKMSDLGGKVGRSFKNSYNRQFGDFDQDIGDFQQNVHSQFGNIRNNLDNFQQIVNNQFGNIGDNFDNFGTGILSQFDRSFSRNFDDVFGVFGSKQTPWWKLDNVCTTKEVLEEEEKEEETLLGGSFHMQVAQCTERPDFYECVQTVSDQGTVSTLKLTYFCCHGYKNLDGKSCTSVALAPLEETIAHVEGSQFLELVVEQGLDKMLDNVTVFVPNDDAILDFTRELEEVGLVGEQNIVYNVDDGLINRRRKRSIQISEGPEIADILAGHVVEGYHNIYDMVESELVESANTENSKIRVTVYPTRPEPTVMANCAKVISRDNHASNGVVHVVDKVIVPAEGTIADVLSSDLHFGTFMSALEKTELSKQLSEEGHFTVFAPTDSAFSKLDLETREKVLGGGGCAGDIIRSHVLLEVVCSGVVEDKVKVVTAAGHGMILELDEEGNVLVGDVKLMMRDKMASNGVIHVIEDVILLPGVRSLADHLKQRHANNLLDLMDRAGLTGSLDNMQSLTIFAPSEQAISSLPQSVLQGLLQDSQSLQEILLHHVVTESLASGDLTENTQLETAGGGQLRVNLHKHLGHSKARAMVQCSRIIDTDQKVCGGTVHTIDMVLTPPQADVLQTLQTDHPQFWRLVQLSKMEDSLSQGLLTVLAPLDKAFHQLSDEITDPETAEAVVRNHLVLSPLCCASVLRSSGFQHELRLRSAGGETLAFHRSHGGNIYVNKAAIVRCDQAASNGVVHSVDRLILPRNFNNKKNTSFWDF